MRWSRHPGRSLDAYLDDELSPDAAERIADHLTRCPLCRHRLQVTSRVRRALRTLFQDAT
jgi:anti-sigma factor RsiW